ncbi:methyltransferase domain-containing protein [Sphaerimonospora thailandensis]|uniref:Protein-L-isoaspartate O-methyltransferase n=1 Tax=Sphaerimonospora thailandensis TaxID=795644 RepID=A0A8J3W1H4_9ACTN|nr:methyltransferase domain-containing protein [Sphaerimonospora thailandensis]GIH72767.1 protein-L-isoaspartate O-methyltransferase [Sphaerimonospora thailandensis]
MDWHSHAQRLADRVTHPGSRWRAAIAGTPRHQFVPAWWAWNGGRWEVRHGPADEEAWLKAAYADRTLVTRIGTLHADHAGVGDKPAGLPTSSSTLPGLVLQMYRHARIGDKDTVLDVGTGSGYGTAVLCRLLGDDRVTSIDVDAYLTAAAADRLSEAGHKPRVVTSDATAPLPGAFDRIVAMVSVRPIPASWLEALAPGGRLATTITNTSLIVTAVKTADGGAVGQVERDWAMFMRARRGTDYPPGLAELLDVARTADGEHVAMTRFPVLDIEEDAWELRSMLEVAVPGIQHEYHENTNTRTAIMVHPDGSWARAVQAEHTRPVVHQTGPCRLWDEFDAIRDYWLQNGSLPLYGAAVRVDPDGVIHLRRGRWQATIG